MLCTHILLYPIERIMNLPVKRESGVRYTWEEKAAAAQHYMLNGNMRLVSDLTGVPYDTLCDWKKSDWWLTLIEEIKLTKKTKTGNKLSTIIEASLDAVSDRLANGDVIYDQKTGELKRKPVSLRDAAQVTNQLITRQLEMERLAEKMEHRKETIQDTLSLLAKEFAKYQRAQSNKQAIDIEVKEIPNAVHDKWEEGLQEGSETLHQQARSEKEES